VTNAESERRYLSMEIDAFGEAFVRSFDEVLVLPLDAQDRVLFAVERSAAFSEETVILAGGIAEPDETVAQTANRELQEELGVRAEQLDYLGELRPWSKYLRVRSHLFLGRELVDSRLPGDERTPVGVAAVPWAEVDALVLSGRLRDARAIAALYLARLMLGRS
jgi:ADP-ribose diphosphatase